MGRFYRRPVVLLPAILSMLDLRSDDADWDNLAPPERRHQVIEAIKALIFSESAHRRC